MRKPYRKLGALLACLAVAAAGCSSGSGGSAEASDQSPSTNGTSGSPASSAEPITLHVTTWSLAAETWQQWWPELTKKFEAKHENVTVDVQQLAYSDYVSSITTQFAGGKGPEIVHVPLPLTTIPAWADAGFLQDLDPFIDSTDLGETWPETQAALEWDGTAYGALLQDYNYVLFYNEKLLNDAGVDVPTTPEELLAAAKQLTTGDQYGFAVTQDNTTNTLTDLFEFIDGEGASWFDGNEWTFTDKDVVDAVDDWRTIATKYSPVGTDINQKRESFYNGNSAMMIEGPFLVAQLDSNAPADIAPNLHIAPQPFANPAGNVSNGLAIANNLDDATLSAAEDYVKMATSPDLMKSLAKLTSSPVARRSANSVLTGSSDVEMVAKTAAETAGLIFPADATGLRENFNDFQERVMNTINKMLETDEPTADLLGELQDNLESAGITPKK